MASRRTTSFRAVSDAVLAIAAERTVQGGLRRMVDAARDLSGARYAALGIPDGEGGFRQFLTAGISERRAAEIGPLPRTHGMLGAMLETTRSFRSSDLRRDPRFEGWPQRHPVMRSFMGVPISSKGAVLAAFYLSEKRPRGDFTRGDQARTELLAAHAAVAIENARLYEQNRELSVIAERNRLARDLHDAVAQKLFSASLTAEAAATLVDLDSAAAKAEMHRAGELLSEATAELRALIFQLRPPGLERDGLQETLRKQVDVLRRVERAPVELDISCDGRLPAALEEGLHRIAQEALHNAVRHSGAGRIDVRLGRANGRVRLEVCDDGVGFDPVDARLRARHLGLTSMEERAAELGAQIEIASSPGRGTSVMVAADA
jgi:signal transduction histidine kinase